MARNRRRQLRELYQQVAGANCQGHCADSCGPIEMSITERQVLRERGVEIPDHRDGVEQLVTTGEYTCPALVNDRCTVYEDRPMICRLWGVTAGLRCPYGCEPERIMSDREGFAMIAESLHIGGHPENLPPTEALLEVYDRPDMQETIGQMIEQHRPRDYR